MLVSKCSDKLVIQGSHMVSGARCPAWSDLLKKWSRSRTMAGHGDEKAHLRNDLIDWSTFEE